MNCAIDICDPSWVPAQEYTSPTAPAKTLQTREAVERFGDASNDLEPLLNGSYAVMATGPATGTNHSVALNSSTSVNDPVKPAGLPAYDVMEWKITLKAGGFQIHYVFFSEEYDEYVGSNFNDKFYILLEAQSTNNGAPTPINFTDCRAGYAGDFQCDSELADIGVCDEGDPICYIAINTAVSECCWYQGCPNGTWSTNIGGTGFSCGTKAQDGKLTNGAKFGSSTGWLKTEWPIDNGEEFTITFHIHDTSDAILDSEVIIDKFLFVGKADPGTGPVV